MILDLSTLKIKLNGFDLVPYFKDVAEAGSPGLFGDFALAQNMALLGSGIHISITTYKGKPYRWALFNASETMGEDPLRVTGSYSTPMMSTFTYHLGPQQGVQWIDENVLNEIFQYAIPTNWDSYLQLQVNEGYGIDPNFTSDAGSSNMEFALPEAQIALAEGMSRQKARWFLAYLDIQLSRARWRWFNGIPYGLDGRLRGAIPGFQAGKANNHGKNAYDLDHLDANELYWGWNLTGDPMFLLALVHLWCHVYQHSPALQQPAKAGNARQLGWALIVAHLVLKATGGHAAHLEVFQGLRDQVTGFAARAIEQLIVGYPIWDLSAVPSIYLPADGKAASQAWIPNATKETYFHLWHYCPVLLGAMRLYEYNSSEFFQAKVLADKLTGVFAFAYDPEIGKMVIKVGKSGWNEYAGPPGVADWYVSAGMNPKYRELSFVTYITNWLKSEYGQKSPYYKSFAMSKIPWALGYSQGALELEGKP